MRMRILKSFLLVLVFTLIFDSFNQNSLTVHANPTNDDDNVLDQNDDTFCADLADFHYEIILSVTAFPKQGDCSDEEDSEIAALLQKATNAELRAIPGTIKTQNKVCADPINDRRRLLTASNADVGLFSYLRGNRNKTTGMIMTSNSIAFVKRSASNAQDQRILLRHGRRSFIYVGGGRCQFCFIDDHDQRALSQTTTRKITNELPTTTLQTKDFGDANKYNYRNLLFVSAFNWGKEVPKVADISLCETHDATSFFVEPNSTYVYQDSISWVNVKTSTISVLDSEWGTHSWELIGPYVPGDSFGAQIDMQHAMRKQNAKHKHHHRFKKKLVELPVKRGTIYFQLLSFDLPTDAATGTLADVQIVVFINGIKLDFELLMSQPGTNSITTSEEEKMEGNSLAGIKWSILRSQNRYGDNFAKGPEPDRFYIIKITAPLVVLLHKNQFDIDFVIKPNASARQYAIRAMRVTFFPAHCEVTDLENSPFEDFKSVVESRLFHKLGINLARKFQDKPGHCFQDKIPVVNVNLVEKESWKDSNPQCQMG